MPEDSINIAKTQNTRMHTSNQTQQQVLTGEVEALKKELEDMQERFQKFGIQLYYMEGGNAQNQASLNDDFYQKFTCSTPHATNTNITGKTKLPNFWKENPTEWFAHVEAIFKLNKIVLDEDKYLHILLYLEKEIIPIVSDIITSASKGNKYQEIKERLILYLEESKDSKLRRLLRGTDFTEEKPTRILQKIRNLAGNNVTEGMLRILYLEQLPTYVRGILAINEKVSLDVLAMQAEKIMETACPRMMSVEENFRKTIPKDNQDLDADQPDKDEQKESAAIERKKNNNFNRNKGRSQSREENKYCYFHRKFGHKAFRCIKPCDFGKQKSLN